MKKYIYGLCLCLAVAAGSCNNLDGDNYYSNLETKNQNTEVTSTEMSVADYLRSHSEYSRMSKLFDEQGIFASLPNSGELHTILVVADDDFKAPVADSAAYVAKSHITNISVAPSKLNDGDRLLTRTEAGNWKDLS